MAEWRHRVGVWWAVAALGWAALVAYLSSRPPAAILSEHAGLDKPVHVLVFGVLGTLVLLALSRTGLRSRRQAALLATLLVAASGLADETYQLFVPLRTFSLGDWLADVAGGVVGAGVGTLYAAIWPPPDAVAGRRALPRTKARAVSLYPP
jgi:VanZ family protein